MGHGEQKRLLVAGARALLLVQALAGLAAAEGPSLGTQECADLGFGQDLRCTTCVRLKEFLPLGEQKGADDSAKLVSECERCCQSSGDEVFKRAVLYVCPSQVEMNQDVEDFVKRKANKFKNLKVKYSDGARSTLQLLREGESEEDGAEVINIRGWKSDEIRDFVAMKLGESPA